ncbi:MAG TPA: phosphoserine phosphatase SerB [Terracidiphilus sp.]|nr:phosphoserine phosphatase SerB [Terracidiphilus sp.]
MTSAARSKTLLLHFAGPDRPGLTAALTSALAKYPVNLLDVGQVAAHENFSLGVLIAVPFGTSIPLLRTELRRHAQGLGLRAQFRRVSPDALQHWLGCLPQSHFIITVLGRSITASHLARVSTILAEHGMSVDRMERLSGVLTPRLPADNACVEFAVRGDAARESSMRSRFLAAAQELSIDIAFQRESIFRRNRRLFVFDMDSTLIQGEVIDELARMAGVGEQVSRITEAAMRGELNFDQSFTQRLALLKGLPAERALGLQQTIPLAEGAERLIRTLKLLGYKTAILSGGFTFFAHSLQQRLGIDSVHANTLEIVDNKVTGRVVPPIINASRKADLLADIAKLEGISLEQVVAVGDGANDIPMLNLAGMGIAYRAKPLVRQSADQSISCLGLDGLLYLLGVRDRDLPAPASP